MNQQRFYNSRAWRTVRDGYAMSQDYICERCNRVCYTKGDKRYINAKKQGQDVVFGIVHHKEYITPTNINDPYITLSYENLEYLCITCHNKIHMTTNTEIRDDISFDKEGNIIG